MRSGACLLPFVALCASAIEPAAATPAKTPPVASIAGPDAFGSVALPLGPNRYTQRWRRAAAGGGPPRLIELISPARQMNRSGQAHFVNAALNRRIAFRPDAGDRWSTASETIDRAAGDCEDYAIAKMQALRALGVPDGDLFLTIGQDLVARQAHAVLLVRVGGRFWVLDNRHDRLIPDDQYRDFMPTLSLRADGKSWLHGFRRGARRG
jgi:predicted transglutaminase-like cysteine proteinase